jgi:hypothetical protein
VIIFLHFYVQYIKNYNEGSISQTIFAPKLGKNKDLTVLMGFTSPHVFSVYPPASEASRGVYQKWA